MIALLLSCVVLLTPMSGVVSGGRGTSFSMLTGLLPDAEWMYIPGIPVCSTGTFTEVLYQNGYSESFRVISSGLTAGINPLVSSYVTKEKYAMQMLVNNISLNYINTVETNSFLLSYKKASVAISGSFEYGMKPSIGFSNEVFLFAATSENSAMGFSIPFSESVFIGPAYSSNKYSGDLWLLCDVDIGPFSLNSGPAIDYENNYQRINGGFEYNNMSYILGWNGKAKFDQLSYVNNIFSASISLTEPGLMVTYQPLDNILLVASHNENGWFQSEIQGRYSLFNGGVDYFRTADSQHGWAISLGINVGIKTIENLSPINTGWQNQIANTPLIH